MSSLEKHAEPVEFPARVPFWARIGWTGFTLVLAGFLIGVAHQTSFRRLVAAGVVTSCFALVARLIRGVTADGAVAGFFVTAILFITGGPAMFEAVLLVFVLTYAATKLGRIRKQSLEIAERLAGRDSAQIFANVGIAALMAALAELTPWHSALIAGSVAALAEAACDTVSSEAGKALSRTARVITSWQRVPAGADGGISLPGTVLGACAAGLVGLEAALTGIVRTQLAVVAATIAILGTLIDSVLGATLERRGWLTNNAVNLISTGCSALFAAIAAPLIRF